MKKYVLGAMPFLFAVSVQAHVEPGTYKGATAEGAPCEMTAVRQYFENDRPHPLNERVELQVKGQTFIVGHPPVVEAKSETVFFDHGQFRGFNPTAVGADALLITMQHSEEFEGPSDFMLISNNWKTGAKSSLKCLNIKLVK